ncbi:MAG: LysR family transcriptional regulator [Clostridia bacterium]|nr:LysR family transcriptional regulator [Clostridia bacterium]
MVNLELYKVFYAVAKHGSLTRAAEELFISQPAVSQAIKQLETQLGTSLFTRTHRGMQLTANGGELIFGDVERGLSILNGVEVKLEELQKSASGTIRIGASETIFQYCLAEKIVEYHKLYPQVKFELISDVSPKTIEQLKTNKCDIGFLNLPFETGAEIEITQSIMLLNDVFVAGERFSELKGKKLSVRDLTAYPLILLQQNTVARSVIDHYAKSHGVALSPAIEIDSWGLMKNLVRDGMGIGCIPREYVTRRVAEGQMFELNVTPAIHTRSVGMALPKGGNVPFALRAFINLFERD